MQLNYLNVQLTELTCSPHLLHLLLYSHHLTATLQDDVSHLPPLMVKVVKVCVGLTLKPVATSPGAYQFATVTECCSCKHAAQLGAELSQCSTN